MFLSPRSIVLAALVLVACSDSSSDGTPAATADSGAASCPDVSGSWKVATHCEASLVGKEVVVTQSGCSLSFAAPFNGFSGAVTADQKITLSGPQSCSGTASATAVAMTCTPGNCSVTLSR